MEHSRDELRKKDPNIAAWGRCGVCALRLSSMPPPLAAAGARHLTHDHITAYDMACQNWRQQAVRVLLSLRGNAARKCQQRKRRVGRDCGLTRKGHAWTIREMRQLIRAGLRFGNEWCLVVLFGDPLARHLDGMRHSRLGKKDVFFAAFFRGRALLWGNPFGR